MALTKATQVPSRSVTMDAGGYVNDAVKYYTPEMFGAVGDGVTDDYRAIQDMLDAGPEGCTFVFDGTKTYYNAFANNGLWAAVAARNMWIRKKGCIFEFNGARLKRRKPEWNFNNLKNNYNTGTYYTDDHTALLWLEGNNFTLRNGEIDCSVPVTNMVDVNGNPTSQTNYAVGTCMEFGVYGINIKGIHFENMYMHHSVFPVYLEDCSNVTGRNLRIEYTAQASARVDGVDLMLGGGFKPLRCTDVHLTGVKGYRNANCTVEIEPNCDGVYVQGSSRYDWANSLVIVFSRNVKAVWSAYNVVNGSGLTVRGGATYQTYNIDVEMYTNTATWMGANIFNSAGATTDMWGINIKIRSLNCKKHGVGVYNSAGLGVFIHANITVDSWDDKTAESGVRLHGRVGGRISGSVHNNAIGFQISGESTADMVPVLDLDLRDRNTLTTAIGSTSVVEYARLDGAATTLLTTTREMRMVTTTTAGAAKPDGVISVYGGNFEVRTSWIKFPSLAVGQGSAATNSAYLTQDTVGQPTYTLKLFRT